MLAASQGIQEAGAGGGEKGQDDRGWREPAQVSAVEELSVIGGDVSCLCCPAWWPLAACGY